MCGSDAKLISATLFELEAEDLRIDAANAPKPKPGAAHPRKKATKSKAVQKEAPVIERAEGTSSLLSDYVKQRKVLVAQMLVDGSAVHHAVLGAAAAVRDDRSNKILEARTVGAERRDACVSFQLPARTRC